MPQSIYKQAEFSGGLNTEFDATKIGSNEYSLLVNGRNRFNVIETIAKPQEITAGLPDGGNKQGIYGFGSLLVVFTNGQAFYRDFNQGLQSFSRVGTLQMGSNADEIYACAVPASTANYARWNTTGTGSLADPKGTINLDQGLQTGSPQCLVVQDGVSQPWLIFPDGTTRVSKTYSQWADDDREYVPVGKYMLFDGTTLYVAGYDDYTASDRKLNQIYRSVSGRPIDFVIPVDDAGTKLPTEAEGGAPALSHRVSQDDITGLHQVSTANGAILVSTTYNSWFVTPDYTNTVFAEPTFRNQWLFPFGAVNHKCVTDALGLTTIIGQQGIRAFDAAVQFQADSKYLAISSKIFRMFEGVVQSIAASTTFDDHALFAVETIYGFGVLVYDVIRQQWVSFDKYSNVGQIKQFAQVRAGTSKRLFFITTDDKLYEAYAGSEREVCRIYIGDWSPNDPFTDQRPLNFALTVSDIEQAGTIQVTPFVDKRAGARISTDLDATYSRSSPYSIPYPPQDTDTVKHINFNLQGAASGSKVGFLVEFDAQLKLMNVSAKCDIVNVNVGVEQQATILTEPSSSLKWPYRVVVVGNTSTDIVDMFSWATHPGSGYTDITVVEGEWYYCTLVSSTDFLTNGSTVYGYTASPIVFQAASTTVRISGTPGGVSTGITLHNCDVIYRIRELIDDLEPDLVILSGNVNYPAGASTTWSRNFTEWFSRYTGESKLYAAMGELEWDDPTVIVNTLNQNGRYFKLDRNNIDFYVLSSGYDSGGVLQEPGGNTESSTQGGWFQNALATSTNRIKVVIQHNPPYTSYGTAKADLRWPYKVWGATLVISANAPMYERLYTGNMTYIINGTGGGSVTSLPVTQVTASKAVSDENGVCVLDIDRFNIMHRFYTITGNVLDPIIVNT